MPIRRPPTGIHLLIHSTVVGTPLTSAAGHALSSLTPNHPPKRLRPPLQGAGVLCCCCWDLVHDTPLLHWSCTVLLQICPASPAVCVTSQWTDLQWTRKCRNSWCVCCDLVHRGWTFDVHVTDVFRDVFSCRRLFPRFLCSIRALLLATLEDDVNLRVSGAFCPAVDEVCRVTIPEAVASWKTCFFANSPKLSSQSFSRLILGFHPQNSSATMTTSISGIHSCTAMTYLQHSDRGASQRAIHVDQCASEDVESADASCHDGCSGQ